jgi:hypothetical protein
MAHPHRCTDDETLAAFVDGLLPADAADALRAELSTCGACAAMARALGWVAAGSPLAFEPPPVPSAWTARAIERFATREGAAARVQRVAVRVVRAVRDSVLETVAGALAPLETPAMAFRGGPESQRALRYPCTLGDHPLELELVAEEDDFVEVRVRPLRPTGDGLLLRLVERDHTVALGTLPPSGTLLAAVPPGHYALVLEHGGARLDALDLDVLAG